MLVESSLLFSYSYPLTKAWRNQLGEKTLLSDDDNVFLNLANTYISTNPSLSKANDCESSSLYGAVHGADVSASDGALMDYVYFKHGTLMASRDKYSFFSSRRHRR